MADEWSVARGRKKIPAGTSTTVEQAAGTDLLGADGFFAEIKSGPAGKRGFGG